MREPVRNCGVIGGGARERLLREPSTRREPRCALRRRELLDEHRVIIGIDDDSDVVVIFRCGADHRRPADVDVLDAFFERRAFRKRRLEGVEIDDEQVDRPDVMREHRRFMFGILADRQKAAVHFGMQSLQPSVHHLRKLREIGHVANRETSLGERFARAAGGDKLHAMRRQNACELDKACFVGNGNQRARHMAQINGHCILLTGAALITPCRREEPAHRRAAGNSKRSRPQEPPPLAQ